MQRFSIAVVAQFVLSPAAGIAAEPAQYVGTNEATGSSAAVMVDDQTLVHTAQVLPVSDDGEIVSGDPATQVDHVLRRLDRLLGTVESGIEQVVKLNVYITRPSLGEEVHRALAEQFAGPHKPAVMLVVSKLSHPQAHIAVDAVAQTDLDSTDSVRQTSSAAVMPGGTRIYISGQAERNESLRVATRETLASLRSTLEYLDRGDEDVVQLKAFLTPMSEVDLVREEVTEFFAPRTPPPVVFVEWNSGATTPIEIELIAWGGREKSGECVEYLTPPGMTASAVFSRVARINGGPTIYLSGLSARAETDATDPAGAGRQVRDVFASLEEVLQATGSDLRHLVKATYYVSTDAVHRKMGELRPEFYDPQRPPAASLARVPVLERPTQGLTIDMIAVPGVRD